MSSRKKTPKSPRRKKSLRDSGSRHSGRGESSASPVSFSASPSSGRRKSSASQRYSDEHKVEKRVSRKHSKPDRVRALRMSEYPTAGECQLCHEMFDASAQRESARANKLPCGHLFHNGCIARWMFANESECPKCGHIYDVECDSDDDLPPRLQTPHGLRQSVRAAEEAQKAFEAAAMRGEDPTPYMQHPQSYAPAKDSVSAAVQVTSKESKGGLCTIQ